MRGRLTGEDENAGANNCADAEANEIHPREAAAKADVRRVLVDYSPRMKELLEDPAAFYKPGLRPSEHQVSRSFGRDNGGAIPANLLRFPNTERPPITHYRQFQ